MKTLVSPVTAMPINRLSAGRAGEICQSLLRRNPRRLFFAGKIAAGKSAVCTGISNGAYPQFNHADALKEEVLTWLAQALTTPGLVLTPGDQLFDHYCREHMGFEPEIVRTDLKDVVMPVWYDFEAMAFEAVRRGLIGELRFFADLQPGEMLPVKVAYVEKYKDFIRPSLVAHAAVVKELCADPEYWVNKTIERSQAHPVVLNADTRYDYESDALQACGWSGVYLWIDRETQIKRKPTLPESYANDISEHSIDPEDCDFVVDARKPLAEVMVTVGRWLADPSTPSFVPPANNGFRPEVNDG